MKEFVVPFVLMVFATVVFALAWRAGYFVKLSAYWAETVEELKKCTWPTWDELTGSTAVVIVAVSLLGAFTMAVDFVISQLIQLIV